VWRCCDVPSLRNALEYLSREPLDLEHSHKEFNRRTRAVRAYGSEASYANNPDSGDGALVGWLEAHRFVNLGPVREP
jgi:hypothetical protein